MNKQLKYLEKNAEKIVFACVVLSLMFSGVLYYVLR